MIDLHVLEVIMRVISALSLNAVIGFWVIVSLDDDGHHVRWLNAAPSRLAIMLALTFWPLVVWADARRYWERNK